MRYLNTNYKLFLENNKGEESKTINKYEIVQFTEDFIIENVYGIDKNISVKINRGEKLKVYFNVSESNGEDYCITGIRPLVALQQEDKSEKRDFSLSELWEANFVLDQPLRVNKNNPPFKFEKYL